MSTSVKYLTSCTLPRKVDPVNTMFRIKKNPVGNVIKKEIMKDAM